jgi:ribosomal protein L37E
MGHFQVLFSGEVVAGAHADEVRGRLAARLGIDDRKSRQLFSGRTVVLRSELEERDAYAFQAELEALGAQTRVKDRTPVRSDTFADSLKYDASAPESTLKDITAAHFECPRCGFLQLEAEHCARCGVNIAQAMRERRKEDLMIEKRIRELRERKARAAAQHGRRGAAAAVSAGDTLAADRNERLSETSVSAEGRGTAEKRGGWLRNLLSTRDR